MIENYIVITSINDLTPGIISFSEQQKWHTIVVGDLKSPPLEKTPINNVTFLSTTTQHELQFHAHELMPYNHYCRKNLGYLYAIRMGAKWIGDTDDDNIPYDEKWGDNALEGTSKPKEITAPKFVNIYSLYTDKHVWPRGFPLDRILSKEKVVVSQQRGLDVPNVLIWQGLADNDPDVDAIYRLTVGELLNFNKSGTFVLSNGVYTPFNSQNTIWKYEAFPYLYLPVTVTFRFTDILRGYVAQRGLQAMGGQLGFTNATVYQERNEHKLLADFESELPCYMQIEHVVDLLESVTLTGDYRVDLPSMYAHLAKNDIVAAAELDAIDAWVTDLINLGFSG